MKFTPTIVYNLLTAQPSHPSIEREGYVIAISSHLSKEEVMSGISRCNQATSLMPSKRKFNFKVQSGHVDN